MQNQTDEQARLREITMQSLNAELQARIQHQQDGRTAALSSSSTDDLVTRVHRHATESLRHELLGRIYAQSHSFFERLVVDVLFGMGSSGRRRDLARCIGKSHDGGVDGLIEQDELGLDVIYIQAKCLRPGGVVPVSEIRDFAGSLEAKKATKGVFVTTGEFSAFAIEYVAAVSRRIVLINGTRITDLMIRHNIGVKVRYSYQFKEIEADYFASKPPTVPR